jgi:hypothetical protein
MKNKIGKTIKIINKFNTTIHFFNFHKFNTQHLQSVWFRRKRGEREVEERNIEER